jgi:hypothetical protein
MVGALNEVGPTPGRTVTPTASMEPLNLADSDCVEVATSAGAHVVVPFASISPILAPARPVRPPNGVMGEERTGTVIDVTACGSPMSQVAWPVLATVRWAASGSEGGTVDVVAGGPPCVVSDVIR